MPDGRDAIAVRVTERIAEVSADEWDACAGQTVPFVRHAFLLALEESGSVSRKTGWLPQHLLLREPCGRLIGAAPLYLKSHSYGEYVFDWSWADAYERAGGRYYPKLQGCVPFTPVTSPRLLVHPEANQEQVANTLIAGMAELARQHQVSSLHVTFPQEAEWQRFGTAGFLQRVGLQYHWRNRGYGSFDDFLGDLAARKRKAIKRERRDATASGLVIKALTGAAIEPRHWDAFYRFYRATSDRKWGQAYLNRAFFTRLGETMTDAVVLIVAEQEGQPVAGALNLKGDDALYGRNWGCLGRFRFLHFELCYYQAIDYAIQHGLGRVEAGAQGEHKIQRGYLPAETYSAHLISDRGLADAVAHFLERERAAIAQEKALLAAHSPYRQC
ncbi:MAG: GNAT family N-acetyltransferase [Kiloniellales bacterium]